MSALPAYGSLPNLARDRAEAILGVEWWKPGVAAKLNAEDEAWYEGLPYWREAISPLLSREARAAYEARDHARVLAEFGGTTLEEVEAIEDPLERVRVSSGATVAARAHYFAMAALRLRAVVTARETHPPRDVADQMKTTTTVVRAMLKKARERLPDADTADVIDGRNLRPTRETGDV